jgi:hypothetical protein
MSSFLQRPAIRRLRTLFRWCRICVWLILLLILSFIVYLHSVGLPDFLKRPLLQRLLASDIAAEFSNMQLGWRRGPSVIIENVAFSRANQPLSPRLSASRAELVLDWDALRRARIHARSLDVVDAEWREPVSQAGGDSLVLNHLVLEVRFDTNDTMHLDICRGLFRGIQIDLIGGVHHVTALRHWIYPGVSGNGNPAFQARLQEISRIAQEIHFSGTPVLQIEAGGDGQDMNSFHAEMTFGAFAAETPWGAGTNLVLSATLARLANPGDEPFLQLTGSASDLAARWARGRDVSFSTVWTRTANSNLDADIRLQATGFKAGWKSPGDNGFGAARFSWKGSVTLVPSNFMPVRASGKLQATEMQSPWGSAQEVSLDTHAARGTEAPPAQPGWGIWSRFAPWTADWEVELRKVLGTKLRVDDLSFSGHWRAPQVTLEHLQGELYGGGVQADAMLDMNSRELTCGGATDFEPRAISPLLGSAEQRWMAQLDWAAPPKVSTRVRVVLPPWTDRPTNWIADVNASLQIAGDFTAGASSFSQVPMQSAAGHVTFTNRVWHVSRLHVVRPDGQVDLDYISSPAGFHYIIDGRMDPRVALPLAAPGRPHLLDQFDFHQPPEIHAQIGGAWHEARRTAVSATLRATNFIWRGEPVGFMNAAVEYTNLLLDVRDFALSNDLCQAQAPWIHADLGTKVVRLTNANGSLDPRLLQQLLSPHAPDWLGLLHFDSRPSVTVSGTFFLTNGRAADLRFLVSARGLRYTNLVADRVSATVDWTGLTVTVTNLVAGLYRSGSLMGWVSFPGGPNHGPDFLADFTARNIDLSAMMQGLTGKTNRLEGRLDGDVSLAGPLSQNRFDWQGHGRVHVHDALLWDIKLFGLLSPVLNLISPGSGHSRAREAAADFFITNSVISSDDLEVRCQGFRLFVRGSVDRNRRINARLEAILSRDTPIIGSFLSFAFTPLSKLFEYRVTGPVNDPVLEPIYVPKFIMVLLHPFHALKSISAPSSPPPAPGPAPPDGK